MGDFLDLAKARRSVRTFDGNQVDEQILDQLKAHADKIENPYGKKIRFVFLDAKSNNLSSPVLSGEKLYVTAVMEPGENAEEAYGYAFEDLLMKAHELGLGTVWIGGTMPRDKFEAASKLAENEVMPCVSPIGVAAKSMSLKEGLMRKGVKADKRFDFDKLFFEGSFENGMSEDRAEELGLKRALEAVRIAPSAVNKQPWRVVVIDDVAHFFIKHDRGYDNGTYDLQKIDLGIGMYHFESQLKCEGKNVTLELNNPGIELEKGVDYVASFRIA
ncbi:nitroreductase family protein [Pseudobutyrivibrio sp.]|uniref:nitroreductase family protein n=1 Tax=Pseudobutyrivibrio sp. TaxID=2014367 RepID=UPI001DA00BF2|nr:nitroreductase family protein [Pseudobutyrivibrio sp.]MBE5911182.1 nitroreductase [Pseudobutyrivibrio sp.]